LALSLQRAFILSYPQAVFIKETLLSYSPFRRRYTARTSACIAAFLLVGSTGAAPAADDEWTPGTYMTQALVRVMGGVRGVTEKTKYGLDDGSSCLMGGLMKVGGSASSSFPLLAGESYAFLGGGDDDTKDLDIYVLNAQDKIVARDVDNDATPVVEFTPKAAGNYRVVLKLADGASKDSFCAFATLRAGGFDVPTQNLATSAERLMQLCGVIAEKTGGAGFLNTEGEWSLVGTILKQGESLTQSGIDLPAGNHAFTAVGDTQAKDVDLTLLAGNKQLAEDTDDDPNPVLLYEGSGAVSLKITNVKSGGPSLTLAAVLNTK
jgi:hypothetical protein